LLVLLYLNPTINKKTFKTLCRYIVHKPNNFITFEISDDILIGIIKDIYKLDLERPPKNKRRKIIFNDQTGLTRSEKLSIVGKLIGRSKIATKENIYECMNAIHDMHECITVQTIARMLGCSTRTVYRNLDNQLKTEKNLLNSMI
jgi:DNA invertase Pin-like site-specific DNA recombinase